MRQVPIGIQDFGKIRDLDLYFVDKTPLIDDILSRRGTEVFLFTRLRRFGKSTNLSMIDAYLNMEHAGNTWFDGLSIDTLRPDDPEKNAYPWSYWTSRGSRRIRSIPSWRPSASGWPNSTGAIRRPGIRRGCRGSASR